MLFANVVQHTDGNDTATKPKHQIDDKLIARMLVTGDNLLAGQHLDDQWQIEWQQSDQAAAATQNGRF